MDLYLGQKWVGPHWFVDFQLRQEKRWPPHLHVGGRVASLQRLHMQLGENWVGTEMHIEDGVATRTIWSGIQLRTQGGLVTRKKQVPPNCVQGCSWIFYQVKNGLDPSCLLMVHLHSDKKMRGLAAGIKNEGTQLHVNGQLDLQL